MDRLLIHIIKTILISAIIIPLTISAQDSDIQVTGSMNFRMTYFENNISANNVDPYTYRFNANPTVRYKNWTIQSNMNIGNFQSKLRQPFNKIGTSIRKDWLEVHLGHRSMNFSPLTLQGHLFLGAGIELDPGKFRFSGMYGRLNRSVAPDSTNRSFTPSFERFGYGFKLGYGTNENFVDLIFFRAEDDSTSIDYVPDYQKVTPATNLVLGASTKQRIFKRFYIKADYAISAYTRDQRSTDVDLEDNFYGSDFVFGLFKPKYSSQYLSAFFGELEYRYKDHSFAIGYNMIEPEYQSMGTYFFQNDNEKYYARLRWTAFKKKMRLNTNFHWEHNNLKNNKSTLNERLQLVQSIQFSPSSRTNWNLNYSGYQSKQSIISSDQLLLNSWTHNLNIHLFHKLKNKNIFSFSGNVLNKVDSENSSSNFNSFGLRGNYQLYMKNSPFVLTPEFSYFKFNATNVSSQRIAPGIGLKWTNKPKNFDVNLSTAFTQNLTNGNSSGVNIRTLFRTSYLYKKKHRFFGRLMHNYTDNNSDRNNLSTRLDLGYTYSF